MSMICPHCKMLTEPMGRSCEFCGKDVTKKPTIKKKMEDK